ncbi:unnamed protein product [Caretta caretta]
MVKSWTVFFPSAWNREKPGVISTAAQPVPGPMRHQEALKLLCEEDQTPISVVCDRSRAHRARTVVAIEEAAQEYKEKIQARLKSLREEREKLLRLKVNGEKRSQEYLGFRAQAPAPGPMSTQLLLVR